MIRAVASIATILVLVGCAPAERPAESTDRLHGTLTVLAAASLAQTFDLLAAQFEADHPGVEVVLSSGGSSALAQQILSGAPADVFASANTATMQTVLDASPGVEAFVFTTNTLELVVPAGNPGAVTGLADLADPGLVIALCDRAVPCGSAAETLLDLAGVLAQPDTLEEDVSAVLAKVALGEADAALVYRTDVIAAGDAVQGIAVPEAAEVVSEYPIAVLADAPNPDAAAAFVEYVRSAAGQRVLRDAGFRAP